MPTVFSISTRESRFLFAKFISGGASDASLPIRSVRVVSLRASGTPSRAARATCCRRISAGKSTSHSCGGV